MELLSEFGEGLRGNFLFGFLGVKGEAGELGFVRSSWRGAAEEDAFLRGAVDDALKLFAASNGPVHGVRVDL